VNARRDWRDAAACRDEDPQLFQPVSHVGAPNLLQIAEAKAICAHCPVKAICREVGMTEPSGIWGGLTEEERDAVVRSGRVAA